MVALGDLHVIKTLSSLRDRRLWENLYARKRSLGVGGHWISLYSCYIETNMLFQRAGACSDLVSRTERVTYPAGLCIYALRASYGPCWPLHPKRSFLLSAEAQPQNTPRSVFMAPKCCNLSIFRYAYSPSSISHKSRARPCEVGFINSPFCLGTVFCHSVFA